MSDYQIQEDSTDALPSVISPEGAEIANTYLLHACSILETAKQLNLEPHEISSSLQQAPIKAYINGVLRENGYRHMLKISEKLDDLVDRKWEELDEAGIGSNKDIADLLQMSHKFRMEMSRLIQTDDKSTITQQKNTQVNVYGEGSYGKLMEKLING